MTTNLLTGGAGFVGTNLADRLLTTGQRGVIFDNLSRNGVRENGGWLLDRHQERLDVEQGAITDRAAVRRAVAGVDRVFHFAAQVAVTTSVVDPRHDFA